jgi:hypothetical protein
MELAPYQNGAVMTKATLAEFADTVSTPWPLPTLEEWDAMSLDDTHALIQRLQASYKEGATSLNQRVYAAQAKDNSYICIVCRKKKPISVDNHPNYIWRDDRKDPNTGVYTTRYICSSECHFRGANSGTLTNAKVAGNIHK